MKNTIQANEFTDMLASGKPCVVVDVRTDAEHTAECLQPCLHLPLHKLNKAALAELLSNHQPIAPNAEVYLLCQSGMRAHKAVEQLGADCPCQLTIIEGGLNALKLCGVTTQKSGRKVMGLERQVRITAGLLVVGGVTLAQLVNPNFVYLSAFVGAGLVFSGMTNTCAMAHVLAKMPWNSK